MSRLLICLLFCYLPAAHALDATSHLQKHLQGLSSFTADFSQRVIDIDRTAVEPSTGSMSFMRPGYFSWNYDQPYEQQIISDGKQIWIYDMDLEQVTIRTIENELSQTPISILDNPDSIDENYTVELLSEREDEVEIQLTPKNEDAGFNYVILVLNDSGLAGMEIYDRFDYYNSLTFENIDLQARLDASQFTFETPEGVDVIHASE
jgi:outer membrane lipoprotein carrier protein